MQDGSYSKLKWFKNTYLDTSSNLQILDVGVLDYGVNNNYSDIFDEKNWQYVGLDINEGDNVDIVVDDIYNWFEIDDNTYDVIISNHFLEHLEFFWLTMSQIERVLKPGGHVCIIVPSDGPKHGKDIKNCYKFFEDGLIALAKYVGLEVLHTSFNDNEDSNSWGEVCLVASKNDSISQDYTKELENKINVLENKLDFILENINKEN